MLYIISHISTLLFLPDKNTYYITHTYTINNIKLLDILNTPNKIGALVIIT